MQYERVVFRRAELHEQVWAEPLRTIAKRAGLSEVALAKICRKLSVPLPGRGFWARKQAGQDVGYEALPPLLEGRAAEVSVRLRKRSEAVSSALDRVPQKREAPIVVPSVLDQEAHPLVVRAAKLLELRKPSEGIVSCRADRCLNVAVSPGMLDRALRIMDALLKTLEARGMQIEVTNPPEPVENGYHRPPRGKPLNETRVLVGEAWISIRLSEICEAKPPVQGELKPSNRGRRSWRRWDAPERAPTGRLELGISPPFYDSGRCFWRDGRRQRIENCLSGFVAELCRKAELVRQAKLEAERLHRCQEEERLRREDAERRAHEEAQKVKRLEDWLSRWRSTHEIHAFVAEARSLVAATGCDIADDSELGRALRWIDSYADSIDPLRDLRVQMVHALTVRGQTQEGDPPAQS